MSTTLCWFDPRLTQLGSEPSCSSTLSDPDLVTNTESWVCACLPSLSGISAFFGSNASATPRVHWSCQSAHFQPGFWSSHFMESGTFSLSISLSPAFCHQTLRKLAPIETSVLSASSSPFHLYHGALAILNQGLKVCFIDATTLQCTLPLVWRPARQIFHILHNPVEQLSCFHSGDYRTHCKPAGQLFMYISKSSHSCLTAVLGTVLYSNPPVDSSGIRGQDHMGECGNHPSLEVSSST